MINDFYNCGLKDLNSCGPIYTWKNERFQERLDWTLVDFNWFTNFKEAYIQHLNWFKSYHRLVLLRMEKEWMIREHPGAFFYCSSGYIWLVQENDKGKLGEWVYSWPVEISRLADKIKEWNSDVFGNINKRKRVFINRLSGIDRANSEGTNPYLNHL